MEIGGYFELELASGNHYHHSAFRLNSGRHAFEFLLVQGKISRVYVPYYTCNSLTEPMRRNNIAVEFYHITEKLIPDFNYSRIAENEAILCINYFGLIEKLISNISGKCDKIIVDNSQAFFSHPIKSLNTFYSPRKFFGVPDGAYLYADNSYKSLVDDLPRNKVSDKSEHLIKRIELGAEAGYSIFIQNNRNFSHDGVMQMSHLTGRILENIDYHAVSSRRRSNFIYLHEKLGRENLLAFDMDDTAVPMVYPLLLPNGRSIREELIKLKVFVATYWTDVFKKQGISGWESFLAENLVALPIDQRYGVDEMSQIVEYVRNLLNNLRYT
jgi:hypothetical protein